MPSALPAASRPPSPNNGIRPLPVTILTRQQIAQADTVENTLARHFPTRQPYDRIRCSCGWTVEVSLPHIAERRWAEHVANRL